MRQKTVSSLIMLGFALLALGLLNLQLFQGSKLKDLSERNCIRLITQQGSRGKILDRNAEIIVENILSYDLMLLPQEKKQQEGLFNRIASILKIDEEKLRQKFKKGYLAPFLPVVLSENIDIKKAVALEELKMDYPGIMIQPHPLRYYPYGRLACHVVGYLGEIDHWRLTKLSEYGYKTKDTVGFGGLEEKYDYYLRQEEGALSVEVDSNGNLMRVVGFKPPVDGRDVQTTIDLRIQKIAEAMLGERNGCIILMNPYNGEIFAMASRPNFNPSVFINSQNASLRSGYLTDLEAPLMNRAISGVYPPASVFKLVVAEAALENQKINLATSFFCSGGANIGRRRFGCWDTHNQQNVIQAIIHSCDVFFYRTGILLGAQTIHNYALKFSFGKPTGINLPYEVSGFVPSPLWRKINQFKGWFDGDTANFAIGQGELLVTPIQMTRMMAVFANRGYLVTPYIVKSVAGKDFTVYYKHIYKTPFNQNVLEYIRQALKGVTNDPTGTANSFSNLSVTVAGKTGSAQAPGGAAHGWFLGFFPFKNPGYVICVFLEHGGSGHAASLVARDVVKAMIDEGLI